MADFFLFVINNNSSASYHHTETMGRITYKAFGKKIQNPGAVITAQTFLWAWREDGKHLAVKSINKALEMNRFIKVASDLLMITYKIFRKLSSLAANVSCFDHQMDILWEGNFYNSEAVSHNLTFYENNKSKCFALQVALSHLDHFPPFAVCVNSTPYIR